MNIDLIGSETNDDVVLGAANTRPHVLVEPVCLYR